MARRKRKEEEANWVAPDFDEVGYMRREIQGAHAAVATILWAVVGAVVAFLLFSVHPALAFFGGIAVGFGLYFILPLFGIETDAFKRKDWAGHGITYFFSWLAFWIILLNPPFGDFTDPTIQAISVSPYHTGYTLGLACITPRAGSVTNFAMGPLNNSFYVLFRATDNAGLPTVRVNVTPNSQTGYDAVVTPLPDPSRPETRHSECIGHQPEVYPAGSFNVTIPDTASSFSVLITATDRTGRQATATLFICPGCA